ncbi:ABC transporter ATP-binding protein [Marinitoga aeolica]|uniref:ATP-binding cassette domain-containing protein n=1 Tax=Marinitoga aeolica TaxID=2809031 RepID=A0ABY8PNH1_9BACT|nr:ATP-binding cassette domain-containing protein [Marinitoga aeolica]WGS64119.1 ATP-binding cassette domain-containing protein [Marinitoga aeolica]
MEKIIEIKNLTKIYKNGIKALKNINLTINRGEKVTIFGSNGAGKTTLIKTIGMFIIPDDGEIKIKEYDIKKESKQIKKLISIATSNERSFYYRLNLEENLNFFGMLNNLTGKELKKKVEKGLKEMGLYENRKIKYMEASTGMKRRLNLARALIKEAEIYLLDEPTNGVDIETKMKIYEIMEELSKNGKTIILASHDVSEIEKTDRIVVLKKGEITADIKTEELLEKTTRKNEERLLELIK